jgi:cbb3-type cytochrome oxidase subunit 3
MDWQHLLTIVFIIIMMAFSWWGYRESTRYHKKKQD